MARRKRAPAEQDQAALAIEFVALAFTIAAKDILREKYTWPPEMVQTFGDELWTAASGLMTAHVTLARAKAEPGETV